MPPLRMVLSYEKNVFFSCVQKHMKDAYYLLSAAVIKVSIVIYARLRRLHVVTNRPNRRYGALSVRHWATLQNEQRGDGKQRSSQSHGVKGFHRVHSPVVTMAGQRTTISCICSRADTSRFRCELYFDRRRPRILIGGTFELSIEKSCNCRVLWLFSHSRYRRAASREPKAVQKDAFDRGAFSNLFCGEILAYLEAHPEYSATGAAFGRPKMLE